MWGRPACSAPGKRKPDLKAYLINLDRSQDRLAHMRGEFGRAGIAFERIAAVDGAELPAETLEKFDRARAAKPEGWLPGEIGCFLSHFEAWSRIAAGEEPWAAVFEDDLRVSPDLAPLLASSEWIPTDADAVRLEANRSMRLSRRRRIDVTPNRSLYRAVSGTSGSGAYILSRTAAQRLLTSPSEARSSVDVFLFKPRVSAVAKGLRRYQVVPAVCVQDGLAEGGEGRLKSLIRQRNSFGRGYRERSHPVLRLWPIRRLAVPFRL